jgi:hypothetical protein
MLLTKKLKKLEEGKVLNYIMSNVNASITNRNVAALTVSFANSIRGKNIDEFSKFFNLRDTSWPLVDVLPEGKVINGAQALIDLHPPFFQSDATSFEPLDKVAREFDDSDIAYEIDSGDVVQYGFRAALTKPKRFGETTQSSLAKEEAALELITIKNLLSVTWRRSAYDKWYLISITNTVINE